MGETYETSGPRCPYCDYLHRADEPVFYDESLETLECDRCKRTFGVLVYTSTSWTCEEIDDGPVSPHRSIDRSGG